MFLVINKIYRTLNPLDSLDSNQNRMQEESIKTSVVENPESSDLGCPQEVPLWYVLRVTYGREMKLKTLLEEMRVRHFLPTKVDYTEKDGKQIKKRISVIPNLIFVNETPSHIRELKETLSKTYPVRYFIDSVTHRPLIIPKRQMEDFIRLTSTGDDNVIYLDNPHVVFEKGEPVEVIYGPFAGVQGYVLRIRRDRKVVLVLQGLVAAAIKTEIKQDWLRRLNE